ncbi:hypothetical protein QWY86_19085 [Pedobacter aquatilis]|uniref:hypothetical protein n=1 Tax=Pedobacter aquatilis TaxID=351343 RepID=UPI0025B28152|nr:hypothetical protein [Pedobacter aquatilis]MDN3588794.1 hypothetical protein [Pedobacter aquatilis]
MENNSENKQEEINNPEQFQIGRTPQEDKQGDQGETANEDTSYTPQETEFADGEGTRLNEAINGAETNMDELKKKTDDSPEDNNFGKSEGLQPEANDI